ncbi:hypothetical protein [Cryobacterium sp. PH31-O1]|uniref:hypothetical protein n=1 Tax=Cryobacterium sp. PH31-O1 TaxID=3046306 RepID=UPI0024B98CD3|nr:hypothetical protein [Cryobacterium sp. PH31-O1]MDJ0338728.1 hypothetical protein [Cryobacterium sp. PH31-O1]
MPLLLDFADHAWSRLTPGPPTPPGPAVNAWVGSALPTTGIGALLEEVWWSEFFHPSPETGQPTGIRQRPTPSAGGCYPVQTHVLFGRDGEQGGARGFYDHDTNRLLNVGDCTLSHGTVIILTVLPQRTVAKYHHRAWPGLIADAAYALTAMAAVAARTGLAATRLHRLGPESLAALAGLPPADATHQDWPGTWCGRAPELAVTALHLGNGPLPALENVTSRVRAPDESRQPGVPPDVTSLARALTVSAASAPRPASTGTAHFATSAALRVPAISAAGLARRRSIPFIDMVAASAAGPPTPGWLAVLLRITSDISEHERPAGCRVRVVTAGDHELLTEAVDRSSAQEWLRHSDVLVLFTASRRSSSADLVNSLWWASLTAANLLFRAAGGSLRARTRPVAGWTDGHHNPDVVPGGVLAGDRVLHGVAFWEERGMAE